jgi:acetyltransferase-like isoleucine patch superfamily enzyme
MNYDFIKIGNDVRINETAIIKNPQYCSLGDHIAIDNGVTVSTKLTVGNYVHISPYVCMIGGADSEVILEDFCFVAAGTKIVAGSEDYTGGGLVGATIPKKFRKLKLDKVIFKKFSGCGVNCSIMPGVIFGEGSILGANSLAVKDLEPWTIYVGSPAKPVKLRDKELILAYGREIMNHQDGEN